MGRPFYTWMKQYFRTPNAADYIVEFPFETTPHMLLGTGMPTAKQFNVVMTHPAFDVPLGYTISGLGGLVHGDPLLTSLLNDPNDTGGVN